MSYIVICTVACLASGLTFLSGFGLGTLLLPAFALFFPVEQAVALTAVVHFLNGLFKLALVGRSIAWPVALRFGLPAIAGGIVGALLLEWLAVLEPLARYEWLGRSFAVTPLKLAIGGLLVVFALLDVSRLGVYARAVWQQAAELDLALLAAAVAAAFAGAVVGKQFLKAVTMESIRHLVAVLLVVVGVCLMAGVL